MATKLWCTGELGRSSHSPSTQILMWMLPACRDTYIPSAFVEVGFLWSWKSGWRKKHLYLSSGNIKKSQYLEIILWIKSLVPSVCDCHRSHLVLAGSPAGLGRKHLSAITKVLFKNENVLPSWIRLDGSDSVLAKMAPPWALLDLISKRKCAVISGLSPVLSLQRKIFPTTRLGDSKQEQ